MMATAEANKVFPVAARDVSAPGLGVTIVGNFASWKARSGGGSSKAIVQPGATIDGQSDAAIDTSIVAWDGRSCAAGFPCYSRLHLTGFIHSDLPIGSTTTYGRWRMPGSSRKDAVLEADPALYDKGVMDVAVQANKLLIVAIQNDK